MRRLPLRRKSVHALTPDETLSLLAFLARGELGPIRLGMSRDTVISLLGPPSDTSNPQAVFEPYEILWYSQWLELSFCDGVLYMLSLRYKWQRPWQRHLRLAGVFQASWARKVANWNYTRCRTFLHRQGLGYDLTDWGDGSLTMDVLDGALIFDDPGRMGLHSINHAVANGSPRNPQAIWQAPTPRLHLQSGKRPRDTSFPPF